MARSNPVAVYNGGNSHVAHLVRIALVNSGVEAFVIEDISSDYTGAMVPTKAQVWVERADIQRAKKILGDYERRTAELRDANTQDEMRAEPNIEVVCKDCGERSVFPTSQLGSVQQCQLCGAYVDVGDEESPENDGKRPDKS
jgi:hypothetical protein